MMPKHPFKHEGEVHNQRSYSLQAVRDADNIDFVIMQIINGPSYSISAFEIEALDDDFWAFDSLERANRCG